MTTELIKRNKRHDIISPQQKWRDVQQREKETFNKQLLYKEVDKKVVQNSTSLEREVPSQLLIEYDRTNSGTLTYVDIELVLWISNTTLTATCGIAFYLNIDR